MRRIALVTDFGTRDPYVAAVKGVIAARTNAPLLDLTHDIEPFDVFQVAWFLRAIVRYWPPDTIFMVVVDPGVGTSRRILALESDGRIFLAPDNGALTFVEGRVWSVENESLFLPGGSTTFHGRDRFAPVAAALANGLSDLENRCRRATADVDQQGAVIGLHQRHRSVQEIGGREWLSSGVAHLLELECNFKRWRKCEATTDHRTDGAPC